MGCTTTTTSVWKKPTYEETIKQFLITSDGEKLVFIGKKYHYIFSSQDSLKNILQWQDRKILKANFYDKFSVDANNKITGRYAISCECNDATKLQIQWLEDNGFHRLIRKQPSPSDETNIYVKESQITGYRYLANNLKLDKYAILNNAYKITVETDYTIADKAVRVAETPIAVAEDGVATFFLVPLLVIATPFAIADGVFDEKQAKIEDASVGEKESTITSKSELEKLGGGDCSEGGPALSAETYYLRGKTLVALNKYKQAMVCLLRAQAEEKDTQVYRESCLEIATMYELGWGVDKDMNTSKAWLNKAGL